MNDRTNRHRRRERVALKLIRKRGHHAQMLANPLVVRHVAVMELGAVVVADEAGELLEVLGLELEARRGGAPMRLLSPRDNRLLEQTPHRLAAVETQMAGARRQAPQ